MQKLRKHLGDAGISMPAFLVTIVALILFAAAYQSRMSDDSSPAPQQETSMPATNKNDVGTSSSSVDPYEGWQTYTSTTYGFSLQYPSDWVVETRPNQPHPGAEITDAVFLYPRRYRGAENIEQGIIISEPDSPTLQNARGGVESLQYQFSLDPTALFNEFFHEYQPGITPTTRLDKISTLPVLLVVSPRVTVPVGMYLAIEEGLFLRFTNLVGNQAYTEDQLIGKNILFSLKSI